MSRRLAPSVSSQTPSPSCVRFGFAAGGSAARFTNASRATSRVAKWIRISLEDSSRPAAKERKKRGTRALARLGEEPTKSGEVAVLMKDRTPAVASLEERGSTTRLG